MKLKVLGLDPSLSNFGIAKATLDLDTMKFDVDDLHVVQTEPEKDKKVRKVVRKNSEDLERALLLHRGAMEAVQGHYIAFVEVPVGSQSSRAMASYGVSLGVIAAVANAMPVVQVTPTEVKMAGCGIKTATKDEMIEAMVTKYPTAPWPMKVVKGVKTPIASKCEHLADAIAAIEAGIGTDEFRRTIAVFKSMPMAANALLKAA
jgi:Holliday junction resolvasome RuvABC endonuclease subunit